MGQAVATYPGTRPRTIRMVWVTFAWGSCFVVIGWGLRYAPVLWFAALRALVAGAAVVALAARQHRRLPRSVRTWAWIGVYGVVDVAAVLGAMFAGAAGGSKGSAAVLSNAQPLLILLPAWWLYGERPTRGTAGALVLGLAGLAVVASADGSGSGVAAAVAATGGTLLARRMAGIEVLVATGWHLLVGGAALVLVASALEGTPGIAWTSGFVGALLFLGLVGTAATSVAWLTEARRARLDQLTAWTLAVPAVGLVLATALLGERPSVRTVVGLLVVLVALGVTQRTGAAQTVSAPHAHGAASPPPMPGRS